MNKLLRLRRDDLPEELPFKSVLYLSLISDLYKVTEDETTYAVSRIEADEVSDRFSDWVGTRKHCELTEALRELIDVDELMFEKDGRYYLGEFIGKKVHLFKKKASSYFENYKALLYERLREYEKIGTAKARMRSAFLISELNQILSLGVKQLDNHSLRKIFEIAYEAYTGGDVYRREAMVEDFQIGTLLRNYAKDTAFAILIEGLFNYEKYRKGFPSLQGVVSVREEAYKHVIGKKRRGTTYMRDMKRSEAEESTF